MKINAQVKINKKYDSTPKSSCQIVLLISAVSVPISALAYSRCLINAEGKERERRREEGRKEWREGGREP